MASKRLQINRHKRPPRGLKIKASNLDKKFSREKDMGVEKEEKKLTERNRNVRNKTGNKWRKNLNGKYYHHSKSIQGGVLGTKDRLGEVKKKS